MLTKTKKFVSQLLPNARFVIPVLLFFLLPLIIFYPIFQGKIVVAGDFSGSDLLDLHLPFKYALHNAYLGRVFPLWEKGLALGFPLLAEGQTGVFYPVNLLLSPLEPYLALNLSIVAAFIVAGIGMYIYCRSLEFTKFSSVFSAITFSQSAFFITRIKHLNMIAVACWIPLAFYFIKKAFDTEYIIKHSESKISQTVQNEETQITNRISKNSFFVYPILLGLIIAFQLLAGHPNMAFLCIFIYFIYIIFEIIIHLPGTNSTSVTTILKLSKEPQFQFSLHGNDKPKHFTKLNHKSKSHPLLFGLSVLLTATVIGLFLSAVQLLPTFELTSLSERGNFSFENATAYPFTLKSLLTFIAPYGSGNPATGSYKLNIYSDGIFWENASYIGLLPFALFLFTVIYPVYKKRLQIRSFITNRFSDNSSHRQRVPNLLSFISHLKSSSSHLFFFYIMSLISILLMMGSGTPVFKFIWENVPGFSFFRFPNRFNLFLIFSMSVISGSAAERLLKKFVSLKQKTSSPASRVKADTVSDDEAHLSWPFGRRATAILVLGFLIADLWVFANSYIGYVDAGTFLKTPQTVEKISSDGDRIYPVSQYGESPYQLLGWKNMDPIVALNNTIAPNKNVLYGLDSFNDRGWFEGGLSLARRNEIENYLLYKNTDQAAFGKILGLFNVKYLIGFSDVNAIEFYKEDEIDLGSMYGEKIKIFRNDQNLPRAYIVPEVKVVASKKEAFDNTVSMSHLGSKTVILESPPKRTPPEFTGAIDIFKKDNPARVESYKANEVTITTEQKDFGFLVLSDIYYPGWRVKVDGKEQKILRANYLVRAVELEAGKHEVKFSYEPFSFKLGAGISTAAIVFLFIYMSYFVYKLLITKKNKI